MNRTARSLLLVVVALALVGAAGLWLASPDGGGVAEDPGVVAERAAATDASQRASARRRLGAPGKVSGEVRRASDRGSVSGQKVRLEGAQPAALEAQTDARGAFEFGEVPHGGPYDVVVAAPGCADVRVTGLSLRRGETRDVGTLWLAPAIPVVVVVRSFSGEPVSGATVEAYRAGAGTDAFDAPPPSPNRTATTGGDGTARLTGIAVGDWTFVASKAGFARRGSSDERIDAGDGEHRVLLALEHGFRIEGRVLAKDGASVPNAEVVALRRTLTADGATAPLCSRARADADGRYVLESLPGADVCIWAARAGGRLALVAAVRPPSVPHLDLPLPEPSCVAGRVTDRANGAPLPGAVVTATFEILGGVEVRSDAVAGAAGEFRVTLPMRGTLTALTATHEGYVNAAEPGVARANVEVPEGTTIERDLAMDDGVGLTGVVRCGAQPVAGAFVSATQRASAAEARTDREGRYRFDALPRGKVFVTAHHPRFTQPDLTEEDPQSALAGGTAPAKYVVEIAGDADATLDLELVAGSATLRGLVVSAGGLPVEGARVTQDGDDDALPVATDQDGAFRLERLRVDSNVSVRVRKEGYAPLTESFDVPAEPDAEPVRLTLTPVRRITGRVRSGTGAPLVDAYVQVADTGDLGPADEEWTWLEAQRLPVQADGRFEIDVDDGREECRVRACAAGHSGAVSEPIAWAGDDASERDVEISLEAGLRLAGLVRTPDGSPVAGAWVAVFPRSGEDDTSTESNGAWGPSISAVADAAGRFELQGLARGWWGVRAWGSATLRGLATIDLPSAKDVIVEVEAALSIDGTVVFDGGAPLAGVAVQAVGGPDGGTHHAVTDAAGAFRFDVLARGVYSVRVAPSATSHANFVAAHVDTVAAGTSGVRVEVAAGRSIAGVVVDAAGNPSAGATIHVRSADTGEDAEADPGLADAGGQFEVLGLAPGRYSLLVSVADENESWDATFEGFAAGDLAVRIVLPPRVTFEGVLVNEAGEPLGGIAIHATPVRDGPASADVPERDVQTDEEGRFSFPAPASAQYLLQLPDTEEVGIVDGVPMRPGAGSVRLVARAGASIAGVVVAEPGAKPVAGAEVTASADGHVRAATTNPDGSFEIRGLVPGGRYSLDVSGGGVIPGDRVPAEAGARDVRVVASRGLSIGGLLEGEDGKPLPGCRMLLQSADAGMEPKWVVTDAAGHFLVEGLPPGEWHLSAWASVRGVDAMHPCGTARAGDTEVKARIGGR